MTARKLNIVAVVGSLRKESYSRKLALQAQRIAPSLGATVTLSESIGNLPFVNQDLESEYYSQNKAVIKFKDDIRHADAIFIATPEYNFNVPGVLKNALDIATRPHGDNVLVGKTYGIVSASPGIAGGLRAQMAIRASMFAFNGVSTGYPEYALGSAHQALSDTGDFTTKASEEYFTSWLKTFIQTIEKQKLAHGPATTASSASNETKE
ncbi:FMN-reductase [Phlyctochytrium arcticum]|nr:FMN-reductase [Phlyctochytrium arcticum]